MAVKLATEKKVWWPVDAQIPEDNGRATLHKIDVQFEIIGNAEQDTAVNAEGKDLLDRVVTGLRQRKLKADDEDKPLQGPDGSELSFEEAKAMLLDAPYYRAWIFAGYNKASTGQGRLKN